MMGISGNVLLKGKSLSEGDIYIYIYIHTSIAGAKAMKEENSYKTSTKESAPSKSHIL
jgi:hypothetical protein